VLYGILDSNFKLCAFVVNGLIKMEIEKSSGGQRKVSAGHASISSNLLGVKASLARVSQSGLKTDRDTTTGGARGTIAKVGSEVSWRWTGRCDGLQ
jgi:hypothetical protein